jgi:hypothetical protein
LKGCPVEPPPDGIHSQLVKDLPVAIQKKRIGFAMGRSDLLIGRHGKSLPAEKNEQRKGNGD